MIKSKRLIWKQLIALTLLIYWFGFSDHAALEWRLSKFVLTGMKADDAKSIMESYGFKCVITEEGSDKGFEIQPTLDCLSQIPKYCDVQIPLKDNRVESRLSIFARQYWSCSIQNIHLTSDKILAN